MKLKSLLIGLLSATMICLESTNAFAGITVGGDGVDKYSSLGHCAHGDRLGDELVLNFLNNMVNGSGGLITKKFQYFDEHAWQQDMLPASWTNFDDVDFAIFSGHGFSVGLHTGINYNTLHLFTLNSTTNFHTNEADEAANVTTQSLWWGNNANTKWVATFSCNLLNTSDPKWNSIMGGVHSVCGYGNVMYLDPRLGSAYATNLVIGQSIKDAFFNANMVYEPENNTPTICRVLTADISANDTVNSYSRKPDPIQNNTDTYSYWDLTVQPR